MFAQRPTGAAWTDVAIPRSSHLTEVRLAGSPSGAAVLIGTVDHFPETSLTKAFRRRKSGTWYCPLVKEGTGDAVAAANEDGKLLVAVRGESQSATTLRFEPK